MTPLGHQLGAGADAHAPSSTLMIVWGVLICSTPMFHQSGGSLGPVGPLGAKDTVGLLVGSSSGLGDGDGSPGDDDGTPGDGEGDAGPVDGDAAPADADAPGSTLGGGPTGVGDG